MPYVNGEWMEPVEYARYAQSPQNLAERRLQASRYVTQAEAGTVGLSWVLVQDTWAVFSTGQIRGFLRMGRQALEETLEMGVDGLSYEAAERQALWISDQEKIIEILEDVLAARGVDA